VDAPTFTPTPNGLINSRGVSTVPLNPNPPAQLSYTLITAATANPPAVACLNTDPAFTAPPPRLEYQQGSGDEWKLLNNNCKDYLVTDIPVIECIL
jgi:hypothetical protein